MPAITVNKEQAMWSNDGRGSLIRRIAALVLCALITVAYTPGMAYALEGQTDETPAAEKILDGEQKNAGSEEGAQVEEPAAIEDAEEEIIEEPAAEEPAAEEPADEIDTDNVGSEEVVQNTRGVASDDGPDMQKGADRASDNATVSISADDQELLVNESTNVRVTADGARLEKIRFNDSYGFWDEQDPNDDNGTAFSARVGFYDEGIHEVYAMVRLEDSEEWIETEHITITATSNGTAGSFDITKVNDSGLLSLEVTRGNTLKIECEQADNADHYWVDVNQNDGSGSGPWVGHFADTDSNTIYFNTIELQPGDYNLSIGADGIGYGSSHSDNFISLKVNKLEVPEGQVYLDVSNTNPETWEEITYSAYCPGADWIEVYPDYDNDMGWRESPGGEAFSGRATYGNGGAHTLKAIAYTYDEENDKDIFLAEASTDITVTSKGPLNIELPELPQLIIAGEDGLSFAVNKPEQADRFKVDVWFDKEDFEGNNNLFWDETDEDRLTVDLPQDKFEEGMTVRVRVEAWGRGYDTSDVETSIPVTGEISDAVTIEASDTEILVNENIDVTVRTNDGARIDSIQLFDGYNFRGEDDPDDNGTRYTRGVNFSEAGDFIVFARVMLQGDDKWITTKPLNISVTSKGVAGDFEIIKVNGDTDFELSVTRGEVVNIECIEAVNADHYWVDAQRLEEGDDYWYGHYADSESPIISFNTITLEPGTYRISAGANSTGYENSNTRNSILLTVEDLNINPDEMYFEVSNTDLETCEEFTYAAYYPGAEWIEVYMDYERDRGWSNDSGGEDSFSDRGSYRSKGTYELVAVAYGKYDEETGEHEILTSKSITMTVSAPNGAMNFELPELPSLMVAGQDGLSFTVEKPVNADGIKVDVWFNMHDYDGDNDLFWDETEGDSLTVEIPQDKFEEGMTVRVRVEAWGRGYENSCVEASIPVTGEISDAVTIEASDTDVLVNEDIDVTVRTKDGAAIDTVQMFAGYDFWGEDEPDNEEGTEYTARFSFYDTGEHTVFARVRLRGSEEWISTEPITINVTSKGRTGDFNIISVNDDTDFDLEVTRGDTLIIKCEDAENASHYWIDAERYEDEDWGWSEDYAHSNSSTIYFNTIELEPGEYRLNAFANGTGYENSRSGNSIQLTVKDMVIDPGEMYFDISTSEPQTCEELTYAAYYPGAEWIKVFMDYEGNRGWSQDSRGEDAISERCSYRSAGTYELVAVAYGKYDEETDEHEILATESRTITVSAPNGPLSIERPEFPPLMVAGQDGLSFTVEKPENADGIQVDVWFDMDGYEGDHGLYWDETEGDRLTVEIPQDKFEEGMTVRVRAEAWGRGYDNSFVEAGIPVTGEASDKLTITASKEEVLVCEDTTIVVDAGDKEIDKVQIFNGIFYWDERDPDPEDNTRHTSVESFDTPGTYTVFAKVRLAGSDEWLTSPSVSIKATANGVAGDFEITGVNGGEPRDIEVTQGDLVSITYEAAEHADHYWIELRRNDGGWGGHWSDTDQLTATLGTAELEPGEYTVLVGANGYGYENKYSGNTFRLKVNESAVPQGELSLNVSKTELNTCEDFTITAYCADAARIRVYLNDGVPEDEAWFIEKGGPGLTETNFYDNSGTYIIKAIAYDDNDQIIDEASESIKVNAEHGSFDLDIPDLPEKICAGSGLSFRVNKPEGAKGFRIRVCYHGDNYEENPEDFTELFWGRTNDNFLDVSVPADKIETGKTIYVHFGAWGAGYDYTEADEFKINAVDHEWGTPTYTWSADYGTCTAVVKCGIDENHTKSQEATATSEAVPAKYDTKGSVKYTATFTDALFTTQTKAVEKEPSLKEQAETAQAAAITAEGIAQTAASEAKTAAATPGAGAVAAAKKSEEAAKAFETAAKDAKDAADKAYAAALAEYGPESANPDQNKVSEAKTVADNAQTRSDNAKDAVASASQSVRDAEAAKAKAEADAKKAAEEAAKSKTKPEVVDLKAVKSLKLKAAKGKITVKWKKATKKELKTFQYYEIQYTLDGTFKDYQPKQVGKKKASVTVKKLLKKKKYTVRIRRVRDDGSVLHVSPWKQKKAKTK